MHRLTAHQSFLPIAQRGRVSRSKLSLLARLLLLSVVTFALSGCGKQQSESAKELAVSGAATSLTLSQHYKALADMNESRLVMEPLSTEIQTFTSDAQKKAEREQFKETKIEIKLQVKALRKREQLGRALAQMYAALASLADYDASTKISTATDGLIDSLTAINAEVGTPLGAGADGKTAKAVLAPLTKLIVDYKKNRDLRKAITNSKPALASIQKLLENEKSTYNKFIIARYFRLLQGVKPDPAIVNDQGTKGIDEYILEKQGMGKDYTLRGIPILKDVPFGADVKDEKLLQVAKANREVDLETARVAALASTDNLIAALKALEAEHDKALDKQTLTLETVESQLEPVKDFLTLFNAIKGAPAPAATN